MKPSHCTPEHNPHAKAGKRRFMHLDTTAASRLLLRRPLFVRNASRRFAAVTRKGDLQNCSKHQIAKWSQKQQFRAASCAIAKPPLRAPKLHPRCAAQVAAPSLRANKKPPLRSGDQNRNFARPFGTPGSHAKSKKPALHHAPKRSRRLLAAGVGWVGETAASRDQTQRPGATRDQKPTIPRAMVRQ